MNTKPLVSIVIPTFNRLYPLAELIEALSRQAYQNFEVIIVNDAGEMVDIIRDLYSELNITIVNLPENQHHVFARNTGVAQANGELIMLIDDDDIILDTHIETMVEAIEDCDFVYSDVEIVDYKVKDHVRYVTNRFLFAYQYDLDAMKKFSTFVPSGCLYRRKIHETIGYFDMEVKNYWDWDFFLRVANVYQVKRSPVANVLYEFSAGGTNQSSYTASMRKYLDRLCEKHGLGELPTKNFFLLLEEEEVVARKALSKVVWDGQPIISRLVNNMETGA
ncbi:glycosyltransferase family 2 protein [Evansella tamaricis]|uniref:Glycosyltransferase n=1 Tax=Evansella tamaricis TaxID=2069301 RepID=A0ABS6JH01_9BACI|nr:glycosyltransferase [Evansella tamaricis]MBU9712680.1 glycosyltransferase [Evansella tamaricis]